MGNEERGARPVPRPASLVISISIFLLAATAVMTAYSYTYTYLAASHNATFIQHLANISHNYTGHNLTAPQISAALAQVGYQSAGVAGLLGLLAGLSWAYIYRLEARGELARASRNSLYLGVISFLTAIPSVPYFEAFLGSLLAGALLVGAWYRIRSETRRIAAEQAAEPPGQTPSPP